MCVVDTQFSSRRLHTLFVMLSHPILMLFAVHIADGVLTPAWLAGGFVVAAVLLILSLRRIDEHTVVRVGLFTAAFFVASQVHIPIGVGSVHLLLNGVVGLVLVRFAPLAITVGLLLQAVLFGHGGLLTLGVNACVLGLPALLAGYGYPYLRRVSGRRRWIILVFLWIVLAVWAIVAVAAVEGVARTFAGERQFTRAGLAEWQALAPTTLSAAFGITAVGAVLIRRLDRELTWACGVAIGLVTSLLTVLLNAAALAWGGMEDWRALVMLVLVAHLPVVAIESLATGVVVRYLERVKPEWLATSDHSPKQIHHNN
jgi:cobalt/nickel transport system permease protein